MILTLSVFVASCSLGDKESTPDAHEPAHISVLDGVIYVGGCSPQPIATLYKLTK